MTRGIEYEIKKTALLTAGLFIFLILRLLYPLVKIRVGCLIYRKMHLAENTEVYLRRCVVNKDMARERHVFMTGEPANQQLLKMIRRKRFVIKNKYALAMYQLVNQAVPDSGLWIDMESYRFYDYEMSKVPAQLSFTAEEERQGKELLRKMGVKEGAAFVCFQSRDNIYLNTVQGREASQEGWGYHDYRNCSIINYLPAVRHLASLGMYVIRMGYAVEKPLDEKNPLIIDYVTCYRSDFGDIYLSAKCKFFLASDTGLTSVPWAFNVPVAYTNSASTVLQPAFGQRDLFIPKKLWVRNEKRFMTFPEMLEKGIDRWVHTDLYEQAGIDLIENTQEEILAVTKEINARLDGAWTTTMEDEELQKEYRNIFPKRHRYYGFFSRIGAEFLRQHREWLNGAVVKIA